MMALPTLLFSTQVLALLPDPFFVTRDIKAVYCYLKLEGIAM